MLLTVWARSRARGACSKWRTICDQATKARTSISASRAKVCHSRVRGNRREDGAGGLAMAGPVMEAGHYSAALPPSGTKT